MTDPAALESNRLLAGAWEFWAQRSPAGEVSSPPGLIAPWMNIDWPMGNLTFLSGPVRDAADLDARVAAALDHAEERGRGWALFICQELLPEGLRETSQERLAHHGLALLAAATGMATDQVLPPRRPLPSLELRPVGDPATRRAFSEINALASELPLDWVLDAMDVETVWGDGAFGTVGYLDGEPVTAAEALAVDGVLYVANLATLPAHRRRGYAEAAMRRSLARAREATGLTRTVLHASPDGLALYEEMGYRSAASFLAFMPTG